MSNMFTAEKLRYAFELLKSDIPFAIWETFYVTVIATVFAFILGLPLGVILVCGDKGGIRSVPFIILIVVVFPLTRLIVGTTIGSAASIVPLVIAAFPFVARLVEGSLREVNPNIIEAALSMGATPFQIITKVMIPESVPSLISNAAIAITTILGYTAMSGAIGGGGLGNIAIMIGYNRYNYPVIILTVVLLIVMVQIFQSLGTFLSRRSDKRLK